MIVTIAEMSWNFSWCYIMKNCLRYIPNNTSKLEGYTGLPCSFIPFLCSCFVYGISSYFVWCLGMIWACPWCCEYQAEQFHDYYGSVCTSVNPTFCMSFQFSWVCIWWKLFIIDIILGIWSFNFFKQTQSL